MVLLNLVVVGYLIIILGNSPDHMNAFRFWQIVRCEKRFYASLKAEFEEGLENVRLFVTAGDKRGERSHR